MELPDKRLRNVLMNLVERVKKRQTLSLRRLSSSRKEEIQFGRFLSNTRVKFESLEAMLYAQCQQDAGTSRHLLLLEDSSQMAFSLQRNIEGLGKIDKGIVQGFYLHPVLTLDAHTGACHGISALEFRVRSQESDGLTYQQRKSARNKEFFEDKEAYRWRSSIETALGNLPLSASKTVVADRESDIYAVLVGLKSDLGVDYVIRSRINRPLIDGQKLYEKVLSWPVEHEFEVDLPPTDERSAHRARLQLRYGEVVMKKSEVRTKKQVPPTWSSGVVYVREVAETVVNHQKPVSWILMTSHPIPSSADALRIVDYYKQRWNVEQLFRVLKTKCLRFESSQLTQYEKLRKLMVVALMGAVKVLQLLRARDGTTQQSLAATFESDEQTFLTKLNSALEGNTQKQKNPHPNHSLAFGAWIIARLAGWSGYQSQRPPGPTDFFTGLQRFYDQYQGYLISKEISKDVLIL